jgi:predicted amidophosphoribosyltransferase
MRERHFPRLCRSCRAPMARQADACWRCDTPCAPRVSSGSAAARREAAPEILVSTAHPTVSTPRSADDAIVIPA